MVSMWQMLTADREKTDTAMIRWRSLWLQMPPVSFNNALPTPVIGYGLLSVGKELKMGMDHDIWYGMICDEKKKKSFLFF